MDRCYYCKITINENNCSQEHVIPRCLGGKDISRSLLCKECNNKLGHQVDSKFDKHLDIFFTCLGISTQQKKPRKKIIELTNGKQIELNSQIGFTRHKPEIDFRTDGEKFSLQCRAKNIEQAKVVFENYVKGTNLQIENFKVGEAHEHPIGGESFQSSIPKGNLIPGISKLAINLYLHSGGSLKELPHLISNLTATESFTGVYFFYRKRFEKKLTFNHIFHHVKDSDIGVEYIYIEIFETLKYLVIIRLDFTGEKKKISFTIDPLTKEKSKIQLPFLLTNKRLKRIMDNQKLHENRLESCFTDKLDEVIRLFSARTKLTPLHRK